MTEKSSTKPQKDTPKKGKDTKKQKVVEEVKEKKMKEEELGEEPEEKEKSSEELIREYKDKYLRLSAEFDNYRKRTLREKMDLTKVANEDILLKILPVMDDFERALQTMNEVTDCKAMKEGIDLIHTKFKDFLTSNGVKEINAMNQKFDMDLHEAITKIPAPSKKMKGKIIDVVEKGYYLNDKVIRYSKVVIGE
jgi:molecular chaperone GrpE